MFPVKQGVGCGMEVGMEQISGRVDGRIRRQHRMPRVLIAFNMPQDVVELLAGYSERVGMAKVRVAELALRRFFAAEQEIDQSPAASLLVKGNAAEVVARIQAGRRPYEVSGVK